MNFNEIGTLGENRNGYGGFSPAQIFQVLHEVGTQRFIGSTDAAWRPFEWMQNQGTAGLDLSNIDGYNICRFNECPNSGTQRQGTVSASQNNLRNFSAKLVSNSTWNARSNLNLKTTVGSEYTNLENDNVSSNGSNLPPGAQNVGQAATRSGSNQLQVVSKTLGFYAQEQASFRDRMFFIVAARQDQNSSFGTHFKNIFYPKASLSWVLSDESFFPHQDWLNSFRLRSAYGQSGVSPGGTVALQTFQAATANVAASQSASTTGTDSPGLVANALGNPDLKPEVSAEFENGFESSVFNNRVHVDFTYYNKKTHDAIISQPIAASSGAAALSVLRNLAQVQSSGLELNVNTTIVDNRMIGWDITAAASHNSGKILSLGTDPTTGKPLGIIGTGTTRDSIGLPINGFFVRPYSYKDTNGDGIITPDEVTPLPTNTPGTSAGAVYYGYSVPRDIVSITNGFDLFSRKLRITVLTDYKGGYSLYNQTGQFYASNFATWYSENLKSTPLWDQARTVATSSAVNPSYGRRATLRTASSGSSARCRPRSPCRRPLPDMSGRATHSSSSRRAISTRGPSTRVPIRKRITARATSRPISRPWRRGRISSFAPTSTTKPSSRTILRCIDSLIALEERSPLRRLPLVQLFLGACNVNQDLLTPQQPQVIAPCVRDEQHGGRRAVRRRARPLEEFHERQRQQHRVALELGGVVHRRTPFGGHVLAAQRRRSAPVADERRRADADLSERAAGPRPSAGCDHRAQDVSTRRPSACSTSARCTSCSAPSRSRCRKCSATAFRSAPLNGRNPVYTAPLTNSDGFKLAIARFDTALTFLTATDSATLNIKWAVQTARARAQVDNGDFTGAVATVATVPTSFQYTFDYSITTFDNEWWIMGPSVKRYSAGDSVDVAGQILNAIPFARLNDPRVGITDTHTKAEDNISDFVQVNNWGRDDPTPVETGIDARLIEAEARLQANDIAGMTTILNALRTSPQKIGIWAVTAMPALTRRPINRPRSLCSSARRRSGSSSAECGWAICAAWFGSTDLRRARCSRPAYLPATRLHRATTARRWRSRCRTLNAATRSSTVASTTTPDRS